MILKKRDQTRPLCRCSRSLELQRTSLEENTLLGLKSFPVSLSFACLELKVFGILVITTLRRFDLKLSQSHATVRLGLFLHRPEELDVVITASVGHLLHLSLSYLELGLRLLQSESETIFPRSYRRRNPPCFGR